MPRIRRQIVANFVGRGWMGVTSFVSAPIFVHFLGIEAYGLVGFFFTLIGLANLLDLGFSTSISRELARSTTEPKVGQPPQDLVRTLEVIYWALALLLGLATVALSPGLATGWLRGSELPIGTIRTAIVMIGVVLTFQFPLSLYSGGLMGLQQQVVLNIINVVMVTVRNFGAVVVLWVGPPSIIRFFVWQAGAAAAHTFVTAAFLWRRLPPGAKAGFHAALLRQIWRFAAGVSATTVLTIVVTQMDKVVLSRVLSLKSFGYYSLATVVASGLTFVTLPIFQAVFPHFSALVAGSDGTGLTRLYHQSCQLMSALVLPVAAVIILFPAEVMMVWTGDPVTVQNTYLIVSLLVAGTALNGLVNVPYALQLANGWTSLVFYVNLGAVVVFVPGLIFAIRWHGAVGAAWLWLLLNASYLLVVINLMHRRLLQGEKLRWLRQDILLPLAATLAVTLTARTLLPTPSQRVITGIWLVLVLGTALAAAAAATPATREWARRLARARPRGSQQGRPGALTSI